MNGHDREEPDQSTGRSAILVYPFLLSLYLHSTQSYRLLHFTACTQGLQSDVTISSLL